MVKNIEGQKNTPNKNRRFLKSLANTIEEMINPFTENSSDLLVLDNRDLTDPAVINTVRKIETLGQGQYDTYVSDRLVNQTKPISTSIKKNNLPLFNRLPVREKTKSQLQLTSLKNDCSLFSRLYVASQVRGGNLDDFFEHENHAYPPALSQNGKLRLGTKSDLVRCLEDATNPNVQAIILDGSVIMNMIRPASAKTFSDYAKQVTCHTLSPSCNMQAESTLFGPSTNPTA